MDTSTYLAFITLNKKLNRILEMLGEEIMPELEALTQAVARVEAAADAIIAKLDQAGVSVDPAALQALADRLNGVGGRLEARAAP